MLIVTQLSGFGAGSINPPLIDVLTGLGLNTNLKLCLDAGDSASYSSGQSWLDRSGNGYDFFRGSDGSASTDDPTFNGIAGGLSSSEYWSADGGDFFNYDGANETWMENLHKDNAVWSMLGVVQFSDDAWTNGPNIFGTFKFGNGPGMGFRASSSRSMQIYVGNGSAASLSKVTDDTYATGQFHFFGFSIDEPTGAGAGFLYADGDYAQVGSSDTFDATYTSPTASAANGGAELMAMGNGPSGVDQDGCRLMMVAAWEGSVVTKAGFDAIFANVRGRLGI